MFRIEEILYATGGSLLRGDIKQKVSAVSINSRTIKKGELFIAIKGRRFDGHNFLLQAIRREAKALLISDTDSLAAVSAYLSLTNIAVIKVRDTLCALCALARYHRARFRIPVIAVTGSNGKTTTKEMLSAILGRKFSLLYNPGTENNYIGVSLALFKMHKGHQLAVFEIGANHAKEIDRLSWILKPALGIITNIGPSHLEFFKTLRGVFRAKLELLNNLGEKAKLVINQDDKFLSGVNGRRFEKITFGLHASCDFFGEIIQQTDSDTTFLLNRKQRITLNTPGRHNVYNALASIACACSLGVSFKDIKKALAGFRVPPMRMQLLDIGRVRVINDCYNSNPESLRRALEFLDGYSCRGKKIVICGDMLELGKRAEKFHLEMGKRIARGRIDFLVAVGNLSKNIASGASSAGMPQESIRWCRDSLEAAALLKKLSRPRDIVLIKGSRAMQMENIIACSTTSFTR